MGRRSLPTLTHSHTKNENRSLPILKYESSQTEVSAYQTLAGSLRESPIPSTEILTQLPLFMDRPTTAHFLFMHSLYRKILNVPGIIVEFGVRWGRNLAAFTTFRTLFEPYNTGRRIVGFDTFEGFPSSSISAHDGKSEATVAGGYAVPQGYQPYLENVLRAHEQLGFRGQQAKFQLVKGDVTETLPAFLQEHPETIIALAYFDFDLHEPTRRCLELIEPHLTRGSVIGFDELNYPRYPGETVALRELWGLSRYRIQRDPDIPYPSKEFLVVE